MAGRGPAPKDPDKRVRRNADPAPVSNLAADGELRGPDLPDGMEWPHRTQRWWETWRLSPQAQTFTESDWDFLLDTALLHARMWLGDAKIAAEVRLRVAKFGATPEDRLRLRMQVDAPDPEQTPTGKAGEPAGRYGHLRAVKPA
jgi:hypothetical protein